MTRSSLLKVLVVFCFFVLSARAQYDDGTDDPPPSAPSDLEPCPCNISQIWIDVIVLFEASQAMSSAGTIESVAFIGTVLADLSVGQLDGYNTRVGFITYAAKAKLFRSLNYYNFTDVGQDLLDNFDSIYDGSDGTNIEQAIQLARTDFDNNFRNNTRQVIVIIGSDYKPGGYNSPVKAAEQFKQDGTIITICYVQQHGAANQMLKELASPGYAIDSKSTDLSTPVPVQTLLCRANCFCSPNEYEYTIGVAESRTCLYDTGDLGQSRAAQERVCQTNSLTGNGTLVIEESEYKHWEVVRLALSLSTQATGKLTYWTGLEYDGSKWIWPDQSTPEGNGYSGWSTPANGTGQANYCALSKQTSGFEFVWVAVPCNTISYALCQEPTCDSTHYCPPGRFTVGRKRVSVWNRT